MQHISHLGQRRFKLRDNENEMQSSSLSLEVGHLVIWITWITFLLHYLHVRSINKVVLRAG
jgi:hypothetical protein